VVFRGLGCGLSPFWVFLCGSLAAVSGPLLTHCFLRCALRLFVNKRMPLSASRLIELPVRYPSAGASRCGSITFSRFNLLQNCRAQFSRRARESNCRHLRACYGMTPRALHEAARLRRAYHSAAAISFRSRAISQSRSSSAALSSASQARERAASAWKNLRRVSTLSIPAPGPRGAAPRISHSRRDDRSSVPAHGPGPGSLPLPPVLNGHVSSLPPY